MWSWWMYSPLQISSLFWLIAQCRLICYQCFGTAVLPSSRWDHPRIEFEIAYSICSYNKCWKWPTWECRQAPVRFIWLARTCASSLQEILQIKFVSVPFRLLRLTIISVNWNFYCIPHLKTMLSNIWVISMTKSDSKLVSHWRLHTAVPWMCEPLCTVALFFVK